MPGPRAGSGGGREQQAHDEQGADRPVRGDDRQGDERDEHDLGQARVQAERRGLAGVERQRGERPVERHGDGQGDGRGDREAADVRPGDGEDVPEQDRGDVGGERPRRRHDDHPEREHPDEEQADRGVVRQSGATTQRSDTEHHDAGAHRGAEHRRDPGQGGDRDAGQHAVRERLAQERHAAHQHPRADDGAQDRRQGAADQGAHHEVDGERIGQPGHGPRRYMKTSIDTDSVLRCLRPSRPTPPIPDLPSTWTG
ncbi:Eukaryotic translation initiation factor 3 110 kDa subunit [Bacillus altitudinis]|nr:Eukaryotic translation initiation factor 3 110 kDa subunit [Bacillus altitudinis]